MKSYILNILLFLFFLINYISSSTKIMKLIPILEYAQNDTHIFIHIINKQLLPIENLNILLTSSSIKINYVINNKKENIKYLFNREIILFSLCKNNSLFIKKENELNYIIFFEKIIPTFYWNYLDQDIDDHNNIYIWFDLYDKYQEKSKFNEYKDFIENNQIINNYNIALKEKEEQHINKNKNIFYSSQKRNNKLQKIKEEYNKYKKNKIYYYKYKNKFNSFPLIKKCYSNNINDIFDINFWDY